uniref:hypothetical protein n=1 Tax=Citrobacter sp. Res13-Sevr-PEB04-36 TaxID=2777960 RepID=UPI0018AD0265
MLKQKHENEFHFALVESVLQLKTLDAYVENNENKVHLIIRLNGERKNEQEILNFIKLRDERYSSVQILNIQRKNKIHLLLNIFKLKILLLGKKKITLIVGDPHARWMNIISSFKNIQNVTYLEDGMST